MEADTLFLALIRSCMTGTDLSQEEKAAVTFPLFKQTLLMGRKQDLGHLIYVAAERQGVLPIPADERERDFLNFAERQKDMATVRYIDLDTETAHIRSVLTRIGVEHIFLKGAVLRDLYPEPWLRTSCDIDVLVHRQDLPRAVEALTADGYTRTGDVQYHDVVLQCGRVCLELHHNIMENTASLDTVLARVWEYAELTDGCEKTLQTPFFVFHQVAHAAYHFIHGGIGFRPFIDLWLLEQQGYDEEKVRALCREAGIERFFDRMRTINACCFDNMPLDANSRDVLDFVVCAGDYAAVDSGDRAAMRAGQTKRWRQIFRYIFVPYRELITIYPAARHRILVPFFQVRRWFDRLFVQKKGKAARRRMRQMRSHDRATLEKTASLKQKAGLTDL